MKIHGKEEFNLFYKVLKARKQAGLTRAEIADRMGTKAPTVARIEAGAGRNIIPRPSPHCAGMPRQWGASSKSSSCQDR